MANSWDQHRMGIEKLTDTNYHIWSYKMKLLLIREDLWRVVQDTPPAIITTDWNRKNDMAVSTIGLMVENKFLVDIKHLQLAKEAWKTLQHIHQRNNLGTRLTLYRRLFNIKHGRDQNMGDHLSLILQTASQLEDIGHPVGDELLCSALLGSLSPEYNNLITAIEGRGDDNITVQYVREKIMEEYQRRTGQSEEPHTAVKALHTPDNPREFKGNSSSKCFYCNRVGHVRRDCRLLRRHQDHQGLKDTSTWTPKRAENTNYSKHTVVTDLDTDNVQQTDTCQPFANAYLTRDETNVKALSSHVTQNNKGQWIIDSGASHHMVKDSGLLTNYRRLDTPIFITSAGGGSNPVKGMGDHTLFLKDQNGMNHPLLLKDVYHIPELEDDLISIAQLGDLGYSSTFTQNTVTLKCAQETLNLGIRHMGLYVTPMTSRQQALSTTSCLHLWHHKLGHRNLSDIMGMNDGSRASGVRIAECHNSDDCSICCRAKMKNKPFPSHPHPLSKRPFESLHSDVCGPISPQSLGGNRYVLTIIDDHTRYLTTYQMSHKHEAATHIKHFIEHGENKFHYRPRKFRSDGGGEYINADLNHFFETKGIHHEVTLPYTPQQNGLSERFNGILLGTTRSLLIQAKLPENMWGEMVHTATYLTNLVIPRGQKITPFEAWHNKKPVYDHLRLIGTQCYFFNSKPHKNKLEERSNPGLLVGYGPTLGTYRIWSQDQQRIHLGRQVVFPEEKCPTGQEHRNTPTPNTEVVSPPVFSPILDSDQAIQLAPVQPGIDPVPPLRKSSRKNLGSTQKQLSYDNLGRQMEMTPDWYTKHPVQPPPDQLPPEQ